MERIKIFTKSNCPKCPPAKDLAMELQKEGFHVIQYDLDTIEGLAEASYYSILSTPSLIIENETEDEIASWRGGVPDLQEVKQVLFKAKSC
jgi:glutaredoxin